MPMQRCQTPLRSLDNFIDVMVRSYLRRYGLPMDDQEDAVQAVFERLACFPNIVTLTDVLDAEGVMTLKVALRPGYNTAYLKRMVSTAINRWRKLRMRSRLHNAFELLDFDSALPSQNLKEFEELHDAHAMLNHLKPAEKAVVTLYHELGSMDSVAGRMKRGRWWCESRYRSGMLKLQIKFKDNKVVHQQSCP